MPTPQTPPSLRFRLHPAPGDRRFYRVLIFPTAAAMYAYWDGRQERRRIDYRAGYEPRRAHDFAAITSGWESFRIAGGVEVPTNDVGEILFHERRMGAGIVAHEMCHAAHFWLERQGLRVLDLDDADLEEQVCLVVGHLCRKFWAKYFTLKAQED
jgi:hypothetical protein